MLIVNNEILEKDATRGKNADAAAFYRDAVSELRSKFGDSITFYRPGVVKRNPSGHIEPIPPMTVHLVGTRESEKGLEEWMYVESIPPKRDGIFRPQKTSIFMTTDLQLSLTHDIELAFFLAYISGEVKSGLVKIRDKAKEAEEEAMKKRSRVDIEYFLYGEDSPLNDVAFLKDVAAAFGVAGVKNLTAEQTRVLLDRHLMSLDIRKASGSGVAGSKEFIAMVKGEHTAIKKRAFISSCIDRNILVYDEKSGKFTISGVDAIVVPPAYRDPKDAFLYFSEQIVKKSFREKWLDLLRAGVDERYLASQKKLDDFKWLLEDLGIKYVGKSLKSLKEDIIDNLASVPAL